MQKVIFDQHGTKSNVMFVPGHTLNDLLSMNAIDPRNVDVLVNGSRNDLDYELRDGDEIQVTSRKVKSGA